MIWCGGGGGGGQPVYVSSVVKYNVLGTNMGRVWEGGYGGDFVFIWVRNTGFCALLIV